MRKKIAMLLAVLLLLGAVHLSAFAANPFLPLWERIPDGEPRVFTDPVTGLERLYVYGSHDSRVSGYCGPDHVVWSAPVDDLNNWRHEGEVFRVNQLNGLSFTDADGITRTLTIGASNPNLYAPDVVYHPENNKYYMYLFVDGIWNTAVGTTLVAPHPTSNPGGNGNRRHPMFVAESDSPAGPFTNPKFVRLAFDPAVLVDDVKNENGKSRVYLYWTPENTRNAWACELDPDDMATMLPGTLHVPTGGATLDVPTAGANAGAPLRTTMPDWREPFYMFEGASIRKVNDLYILAYCRAIRTSATATTNISQIGWAYSDNPYGDPALGAPWTFGGVIVDNRGETIANPYGAGTSTTFVGGNVHGGMIDVNGQWYQIYHRDTNISSKRQAMAEPFDLRFENGAPVIDQVEMTSQGFETGGLNPYKEQNAGIACYIYPASGTTAPNFYSQPGTYNFSPAATRDDWFPIQNIRNQSWVGYKYFNFGEGAGDKELKLVLTLNTVSNRSGTINVYANDPKQKYADPERPKTLIGTINMAANNTRHTLECVVDKSALTGKKGIYLEFRSTTAAVELCQLGKIRFKTDSVLTDVSSMGVYGVKYEDTNALEPGAILIIAQYDAQGVLVSLGSKAIQSGSETLYAAKTPGSASAKAFAWDSDMCPLEKALKLITF